MRGFHEFKGVIVRLIRVEDRDTLATVAVRHAFRPKTEARVDLAPDDIPAAMPGRLSGVRYAGSHRRILPLSALATRP
jgi:hypothetical protein